MNPFEIFTQWWKQAQDAGVLQDGAMALSSANERGEVSSRMVLLKRFSQLDGFCFFTNYESRKARQFSKNPQAALLFYWPSLGRQIRIEGIVSPLSACESDEYFATRDRLSQMGAWASLQSQKIPVLADLESRVNETSARFGSTAPIPRPPTWGGYRLEARYFEFWLQGAGRLHHRQSFQKDLSQGRWESFHLYP